MTAEKIRKEYSDETRLALLEQSIVGINATLVRIEKTITDMRSEFNSEAKTHFRWIMGTIFGLYTIVLTSLAGIVIKLVH